MALIHIKVRHCLLAIHQGTDDQTVPYRYAAEIQQLIPSSNLLTVENGTHDLTVSHPDIISDAFDSFFRSKWWLQTFFLWTFHCLFIISVLLDFPSTQSWRITLSLRNHLLTNLSRVSITPHFIDLHPLRLILLPSVSLFLLHTFICQSLSVIPAYLWDHAVGSFGFSAPFLLSMSI